MRVIVVDDEEHARNRLKRLLENLSVEGVEVFDRSIYAQKKTRRTLLFSISICPK